MRTASCEVGLVRVYAIVIVVLLWGSLGVSGCTNNYGMDVFRCRGFHDIRDNCSETSPTDLSEQRPCRRVCHPEECLLSTPWQREVLTNETSRTAVIDYKIECITRIAKTSKRKGCYDKEKFYNVTRDFLDQFVYPYGIETLPAEFHNPVFEILSSGSAVIFPTLLYHKEFSICIKFALSQELNTSFATGLFSFATSQQELFRVSLFKGGRIHVQSVNIGGAVFVSPSPFAAGQVTTLCVSFRVQPRIETTVWIRNEGGLLTRLQPAYVRRFTAVADRNLNTLLGIVSVGESPKMLPKGYPSFVGELHSIRILDRFLDIKKQVLPFIRCVDNPLDTLKSLVAGAIGMATWENEPVNKTVWSHGTELIGDVRVRNGTEEDRFCGDQCASCKLRCMQADTNCSFIKSCASCEQLSCPDSTHYQRTYKDVCLVDPVLNPCNSSAISFCFERKTNTCQDLDSSILCLKKIDLDGCSQEMWRGVPYENDIYKIYKQCVDSSNSSYIFRKIGELIQLTSYRWDMSECGQACVMTSGLWDLSVTQYDSWYRKLRMSDNGELCTSVADYLNCIELDECAEKNLPDDHYTSPSSYAYWLYPTVERMFLIQDGGCQLAPECTNLLNTSLGQTTLANVKLEISKYPLPKKRSDLERANRQRQIKLPTRQEMSKCRKLNKSRGSNSTLSSQQNQDTTKKQGRNRRWLPKRSVKEITTRYNTTRLDNVPASHSVFLSGMSPRKLQKLQSRSASINRDALTGDDEPAEDSEEDETDTTQEVTEMAREQEGIHEEVLKILADESPNNENYTRQPESTTGNNSTIPTNSSTITESQKSSKTATPQSPLQATRATRHVSSPTTPHSNSSDNSLGTHHTTTGPENSSAQSRPSIITVVLIMVAVAFSIV
ncbi:uncharacterized protein LOC134821747 [Bolinopsis microptera]|uniref:uncharacterized protein LOC134821747 n=1 Tax=Bolinopsis microptera TaxID=2820187 RepID=UPI00307A6405